MTTIVSNALLRAFIRVPCHILSGFLLLIYHIYIIMGRRVEKRNAGVYIEINVSEEKMDEVFPPHETYLGEWINEQKGQLFSEGEMPFNLIFVADEKYDLSANIVSTDIDKLYDSFTKEYESVLSDLMNKFGDNNVDVKIGVIDYLDEEA